jgi:hypothetical protein
MAWQRGAALTELAMANDLLYKASLHLGASSQNKRSSLLYKIQTVENRQQDERVLVYDEGGAVAQGRKLRLPWLGPYRVEKKLSDVSYVLCAEIDARVARVHVNRMRRWDSNSEENAREQMRGCGRIRDGCCGGSWSDGRRKVSGSTGFDTRDGVDVCGYRRWNCLKLLSRRMS